MKNVCAPVVTEGHLHRVAADSRYSAAKPNQKVGGGTNYRNQMHNLRIKCCGM